MAETPTARSTVEKSGPKDALLGQADLLAATITKTRAERLPSAPERPGKRERSKPPLPEMLRPFIEQARERHKRRPPNPAVTIRKHPTGYGFESLHRDEEAWMVHIADAFGTRSESTVRVFLGQLADLCSLVRDESGNRYPSELELNAALNIVHGVRPRNEMEAALAAQMVAVHFMTMKLAGATLSYGSISPHNAAIIGKLARTFAMQLDTLGRLRGRVGRQTIKVKYERHEHRHVHVGEGGLEKGTQALAPACRADRNSAREPNGSPRCGAKTRRGTACQGAAVRGKKRCRVHGGAKGSGAPKGERNGAYKTGEWAKGAVAQRRAAAAVIKAARRALRQTRAVALESLLWGWMSRHNEEDGRLIGRDSVDLRIGSFRQTDIAQVLQPIK